MDSARTLIDEALEITHGRYAAEEAYAFFVEALYYWKLEAFEKAIDSYGKAAQLYRETGDELYEVFCYYNSTLLLDYTAEEKDRLRSNAFHHKTLKKTRALMDAGKAHVLYNTYFALGDNFRYLNQKDSSQLYFLKAIELSKTHPTSYREVYVLACYNYMDQYNYGLALETAQELIQRAREKKDKEDEMWGWSTLAFFYRALSNKESAAEYYEKAYQLAEELQDTNNMLQFKIDALLQQAFSPSGAQAVARLFELYDRAKSDMPCALSLWVGAIGDLLIDYRQYDRALSIIEDLLARAAQCDDAFHMAKLLTEKADLLLLLQKNEEALALARRALRLSDEKDNPQQYYAAMEVLSRAEAVRGLSAAADDRFRKVHAYRDSIESLRLKAIANLTRIQEQDKAQLVLLEKENSHLLAQHRKNRQIKVLLGAGLAGAIILIGLFLDRRKIMRKANQLSEDLNKQIETLGKEISAQADLLSEDLQAKVKHQKSKIFDLRQRLNQEIKTLSSQEKLRLLNGIMEQQSAFQREIYVTAARKEEELRAFNYTISHDLKAPLVNASNFVDLLEVESSEDLNPKIQSYLQQFRYLLNDMKKMIEGISKYAYYDHEAIHPRKIEPALLFQEIFDQIRQSTPSASRIDIQIHNPLPNLFADPFLLRQVAVNLLTNAVKFSAPVEKPQIAISGLTDEHFAKIVVADNGVGIPSQAKDRLFQLFRSAHKRNEFPGTGVGLAIVKRIVEKHGGSIFVESAGEGLGASFTIRLPRAE